VDKALVEHILAAKRAKGGTGIPACASAPSQTRMSVALWEREIDDPPSLNDELRPARRVYRLYGLTAAEIKIVEGERKG
jgi:hypothetical protein